MLAQDTISKNTNNMLIKPVKLLSLIILLRHRLKGDLTTGFKKDFCWFC